MIQGYPDFPSIFPGEAFKFHVSTDAIQFRIDIYKQGVFLDYKTSSGNLPGFFADDHDHDQDWGVDAIRRDGTQVAGWPAYPFTISDDFESGAYIAMFIELDGQGNPDPQQFPPLDPTMADARMGKALFVVKNPVPGVRSQVLYKLPYFTYQSYNYQGGGSIYQGVDINLRRPGGGTGGTPWDSIPALIDNYDPLDNYNTDKKKGSPRNVFQHWDAKLISWLEYVGFQVDYCTDWDVHQDDGLALLMSYALVLSAGHDEYYSEKMRNNLENFILAGGNMAFLSGNTCWWRTEFSAADPFHMFGQQTIQNWYNLGRPEDSLTGVSFYNAGERNAPHPSNDSEKVGYTVQNTHMWPFENTGLDDGDVFAKDECIIGYECDGAPVDKNISFPFVADFNQSPATPHSFTILGTGDVSGFEYTPNPNGSKMATMGMYSRVGTVFAGATTDWPRVVWQGEPKTMQITRNVLNRLGGNPKGLAPLRYIGDIICADGFYSDDDGYRHAIVGSGSGAITEIFFNPRTGLGATQISAQEGLLDLGCFYTEDDEYRHVITASDDGDIYELFYHPQTGLGKALLGNVPGAIRVCGFYSADDNYRHAIVATSGGAVIEIFYHPQFGKGQVVLGNFENIIDIGCFYTPDDEYRHAMVGTADGNITEIFFHPEAGIFNAVIANVPDLFRLSGYHAADDRFYNRRVQILTTGGRLHEVRYHPDHGIMRCLLYNVNGVEDIGAFFSGDDGYRHSIFAFSSGEVKELYFNP